MEPAFRLEALPDTARDMLFKLLPYKQAARACLVSRSWNATLSLPLWSRLAFDDAHGGGSVTDAVVRGAIAKARGTLRNVTLPHASLLNVLDDARVSAALRSVEVKNDCDVNEARAVLFACTTLEELHIGLGMATEDMRTCTVLAVLNHRALRAKRLSFSGHTTRNLAQATQLFREIAGALSKHAGGLQSLDITLTTDFSNQALWAAGGAGCGFAHPARITLGEGLNAFVAALSSCTQLQHLHVPRLFSAAAFAHVARAIAQRPEPGSQPVRSYSVVRDDVPHYIGAVMEYLLPKLPKLSVLFMPSPNALSTDEDAVYPSLTPAECSDALGLLSDGLHGNTQLQELDVRYDANAMSGEDVHVFHDALATTRITHFALSGYTDAQCRSLAARLWPALQSLTLHQGEHAAGTLEVLLRAVDDAEVKDLCLRECGCDLPAVAAFLRHNTHLLALQITECRALPWLDDLAAALCSNRSLQALAIGSLRAEHIRAFDLVLRVNTSLRSLVIDEYIYANATELVATINALAASLKCNNTLNKLHLKLRMLQGLLRDAADADPAVAAAVTALRSVSRTPAAQPLTVVVDFCNPVYNPYGYGGYGEQWQ
jgi:hypothetical protein